MKETPMSVSIVGAGNVATHLASRLVQRGITIRSIYSRTLSSAKELVEKLNTDATATDDLTQLLEADVYIIAVKDDALTQIAAIWPDNLRNGVVLHTAGSLPMDTIATTSEHYGVLYPMQTFSKYNAVDFNSVTCFVEGNDHIALQAANKLSAVLFGRTEQLTSAERQNLHLAAVFACNFTNHMYALAYEILEHHGIDPTVLRPLIDETAAKLSRMHPREAQTGPARRRDEQVVNKHLNALSDSPDLQRIYSVLTKNIVQLYKIHD